MIVASIAATIDGWDMSPEALPGSAGENGLDFYDAMDGPSEEEAYLQGEDECDMLQ